MLARLQASSFAILVSTHDNDCYQLLIARSSSSIEARAGLVGLNCPRGRGRGSAVSCRRHPYTTDFETSLLKLNRCHSYMVIFANGLLQLNYALLAFVCLAVDHKLVDLAVS